MNKVCVHARRRDRDKVRIGRWKIINRKGNGGWKGDFNKAKMCLRERTWRRHGSTVRFWVSEMAMPFRFTICFGS
jgi:hypothetical protein